MRRKRLAGATRLLPLLCLAVLLGGVGPATAASHNVEPPNERTVTRTQGKIRVTTAVPSAAETRDVFGFALYRNDIQPVWVKVENLGDEPVWFLPAGIDSSYYTPTETAYRRAGRRKLFDWVLNRDYLERHFSFLVHPHSERAGYVFTTIDEGSKAFNVDVMSPSGQARLNFAIPVPGLRLDHYDVDWDGLYDDAAMAHVDRSGLVAALESLPCCVTGEGGETDGDPLNIAIVGNLEDVYYAFTRAGWDETETVYTTSAWKTMVSAVSGSEYRYSPVSALYVYGRAQDVALQKTRDSIHQRNHLRLWLMPLRYQGQRVWIGQISRDIGVRLSRKTVTTHKIDADVDDAREFLIEDLAYAESLEGFGYVKGFVPAPFAEPRVNFTGDPYFSDGLRAVLFVSSESVNIAEVQRIDLGSHPAERLLERDQ